jgi:hypothetical protein
MQGIVIDKNFLFGARSEDIQALSNNYRLLMSDSLLYELLKEPSSKKRAEYFSKFGVDNVTPYILISRVGKLFHYEIHNRKMARKPSEFFTADRDYQVHKKLCDANYSFSDHEQKMFNREHEGVTSDVNVFIEFLKRTETEVKETILKKVRKKGQIDPDKLISVLNDKSVLSERYCKVFIPDLGDNQDLRPPFHYMDDNWCTYRFVQVYLLLSIDILHRYEKLDILLESKSALGKLKNEVVDAQYFIQALLEGGFATNEKRWRQWWKLLAKDGDILLPLGGSDIYEDLNFPR